MKRLTRAFFIFFIVFAVGCAPTLERREVVKPKIEPKITPLLPADILDGKISFLNKILMEKELSEKDRKIAFDLVDTYKSVKKVSSSYTTKAEYRRIIHDLLECYRLIDEYYFSKGKDTDRVYSDAITLFVNKRNNILDAYLTGDFKGVINHCLDLREVFGPKALTPDIALMFALSLGREEMLEEAINTGVGIARDLEAGPDLIQLQCHMAEWQLKLGHREKAIAIYEKLTDNFDEKKESIRTLNSKLNKTAESTKTIELTLKEEIGRKSTDLNGHNNIDQLLQEVDALLQKHAYNEAKFLLIKRRIRTEEGPKIEIIDKALNKVELAKERDKIEQESRELQRKAALETAKNLIEEEKFEQAVAKIEEFNQTYENSTESEALKESAIEKIINSERNRAAELFLAAKKTEDTAKKEKYLKLSYEILKALIDKYPSSPLNNKLKSHLTKVKEEIDKLK